MKTLQQIMTPKQRQPQPSADVKADNADTAQRMQEG